VVAPVVGRGCGHEKGPRFRPGRVPVPVIAPLKVDELLSFKTKRYCRKIELELAIDPEAPRCRFARTPAAIVVAPL